MSNESYLVANGWIPGRSPKWYRHLSLTGDKEAYEASAMKLQRSYDKGRADALAEVQNAKPEPVDHKKSCPSCRDVSGPSKCFKHREEDRHDLWRKANPAPVESKKDEAMSKISFRFTLDTAVLSSERVLRLPNSDYGIKLNVKHGEPSVMLEIGCRVVNRYDTVVEALSRAYIGFDVEHLIEEKYSVTPKKPEPVESDEEFILRHQWRGGSVPPYWVHDDVRYADGTHVSFLHPRNVAAIQRAINEARSHNA